MQSGSGASAIAARDRLLFILWRAGLTVTALFAFSVFLFLLYELSIEDVVIRTLGPYSSYEQRDIWLAENGYFDPAIERFPRWLGALLSGDFGESIYKKYDDVSEVLWQSLGNSAILLGYALAALVALSVTLGVLAGRKPGSLLDRTLRPLATVTASFPEYVVALLLLILFWSVLGLSTSAGVSSPDFPHEALAVPAVGLLLPQLGRLAVIARDALVDQLRRSPQAGDDTERFVSPKHLALSLLPHVFLAATWLLGGLWPLEDFFKFPGIGTLMSEASLVQDRALVEASYFFAFGFALLLRLLAAVAQAFAPEPLPHSKGSRAVATRKSETKGSRTETWKLSRSGMLGAAILGFWIVITLSAPLISPFPPNATLYPMKGPGSAYILESGEQILGKPVEEVCSPIASDEDRGRFHCGTYWLGTDHIGRDILSRVIWSSRASLPHALAAAFAACLLGYCAAWLAARTPRCVAFAIPAKNTATPTLPVLMIAFLAAVHFSPRGLYLIAALAILTAPGVATTLFHVLIERSRPVSVAIIAEAARRFGLIVMIFATFGFLGLWPAPPDPGWAVMIKWTRQMITVFPHMTLFPIAALVSVIMGARLLANGFDNRSR